MSANLIRRYRLEQLTSETANVIRVRVHAEDEGGARVAVAFRARVKVANSGDYDGESTNATVAAVTDISSAIHDLGSTSDKDIVFLASTTNGYLDVDVTDASAETVTVYVGDPPFGGEGADCSGSLNLVFA